MGTTGTVWALVNPLLFEFNGRTITFQGQVPWLLAPWLIYAGVITLARRQRSELP